MTTTESVDDHLDQRGGTDDVPISKSKYGSHSSLPSTTSTSSLTTPTHRHRKSHPTLSSQTSASDSRLSNSSDDVKNQKRTSRPKHRLQRLNLSLDLNPRGVHHGGQDPNSTNESIEDEDRVSADEEYSTEDDAESSVQPRGGSQQGGNTELNESANRSVNSSVSFVDKAVEELITTERTYVRDLHEVIQVTVC